MTFQASRHEKTTTVSVLFPIETIPACIFCSKEHFPKQKTAPNKKLTNQKLSPNQKNITKQKNLTNQKNSHQIPYTPFRVNPKQNEISTSISTTFPCFNLLRLWCSYQGKDVDYRRSRSKAMEKTQGRAAEGLWLTAQLLDFFCWMEKKENLYKNGGKDVDIYLEKSISFKKTAKR